MKMHPIFRFFKHLTSHRWQVKHYFSDLAFKHIEAAIEASEKHHAGEICFVVEAGLHPNEIFHNKTPRKRAIELFSRFQIWDTECNNGVLIYLLLADRHVEILADRGINRHVGDATWSNISKEMQAMFKEGEFEAGVLHGISRIGAVLEQHFPTEATQNLSAKPNKKKRNEISNKPHVI